MHYRRIVVCQVFESCVHTTITIFLTAPLWVGILWTRLKVLFSLKASKWLSCSHGERITVLPPLSLYSRTLHHLMIRHYLSRDETLSRLCRLTDSLKMSMPLLMATLINRLMRVFINDVSTGRTAAVGICTNRWHVKWCWSFSRGCCRCIHFRSLMQALQMFIFLILRKVAFTYCHKIILFISSLSLSTFPHIVLSFIHGVFSLHSGSPSLFPHIF